MSSLSSDPALSAYNAKRDFAQTAEPPGRRAAGEGHRFLVQKHAARRLHYDFRLELDGVLLSWAVTRGPSLDPAEKRLAVRTEDHPVSYADFEGTIPAGQYGGGTVMLWDRGRWRPEGDPRAGLRDGRLRFRLDGARLRGDWMLIRMRGKAEARENWLLCKLDDAEARTDFDLTEAHAASVLSGRTMEEIAGTAGRAVTAAPRARASRAKPPTREAPKAPRAVREASGSVLLRHGVRITSPDREPYPDAHVSKRDLVAYYERVAALMLPEIRGRPLTLIRCPRGVGERCFVQQHAGAGLPGTVRRVRLREATGTVREHVAVDDLPGLLGLVQMGVLEFHGWGSRAGSVASPDRLVLDLDPDPALPFSAVVEAARTIRERLAADGLAAWPMLSGGKGIHVVVPLVPLKRSGWSRLGGYAEAVARALAREEPARFTANVAKGERAGRIYVDYLRNERGATAVIPFSTRAKPAASLAMPLSWEALTGIGSPQAFTLRRVLDGGLPDLAGWAAAPQTLPRGTSGTRAR
ncbi:bifunctional non-homologous end joining protein LigD [Methylobacterium sp. BE186]|uniref:non-homologous end-joining DNA ligase n=1 Tax=Methylobacterium sp. BE186 TaxID=2817715 RepID=UPI002867A108|nr:non-homologous end-joining DNA ligase [Methylobacterium sp. BE186]MDR7035769.1 bifunctional non-homologous end joining protein LigD [Methylobacterium sp. BE186]